ncbi:putative TetR family transcriptional regulator [Gordonia polyisoprenivorans NBRC 16320 = JCM 10675]|uniref:TetR/AcrR family transcriptional regulator n=1 Tax=Gordonia polyisoprenivorans TaxID=84595 RepID=A0A846WF31_9ACTN|nr:TetR/AcrR family transcriptional regulator [Gordonia polyisoprenivorans]GAB24402.1 putative TetR family transcriptional regulator [Gordonia polyisoprenivorans NBRC 16320 = JCM 10675]
MALVQNRIVEPLTHQSRIHQIVKAAIDILDDGGVESLNMRGLAAHLHLRPMTLYYYVPNKSALLTMVLTETLDRLESGTYCGPPQTRLLSQSMDLYTRLSSITWIPDLLAAGAQPTHPSPEQAEQFLVACHELGLDAVESFGLWRSIWFLVSSELMSSAQTHSAQPGESTAPDFTTEELTDRPLAAHFLEQWVELRETYSIAPHIAALIDGAVSRANVTSTPSAVPISGVTPPIHELDVS